MKCPDERIVQQFVDAELDAHEQAAFEAHLKECADCQLAVETMQQVRETVSLALSKKLENADLSPIWDGVQQHIRAQEENGASMFAMLKQLLKRPALVLASSTAVVILAFVMIFFQLIPGQRDNAIAEAAIVESINCDDPDIIVTYSPPQEGETTVVYITGFQSEEDKEHETPLP